MPLQATSVRLDNETLHRIGEMAAAMDRPRAWLMAYAIKEYVARELAAAESNADKSAAGGKGKKKSKKKGKKKSAQTSVERTLEETPGWPITRL